MTMQPKINWPGASKLSNSTLIAGGGRRGVLLDCRDMSDDSMGLGWGGGFGGPRRGRI